MLFQLKINDFLTFLDVEKNASIHTVRAYESDLTQLLHFWEHLVQKEPAIKSYLDKVIQRYTVSLFYRKISKTSLARKFSSLRAFINFLKRDGVSVEINFKSPRLDKKLPTTLTVDEIFYLLDAIKLDDLPTKYPYRDKAIFEIIYATGVRCSELINIKLEDINFHDQLIKILGKGKKERMVLFGSKAQKRIEEYLCEERIYMIKQQDSRYIPLDDNSIDCVITSPPYYNNIDYTKVYEIENWFVNDIMKNEPSVRSFISGIDKYFEDMTKVLEELYRVCKPGAQLAIVVGNGFDGKIVESDILLSEIAEKVGFVVEKIITVNERFALKDRTTKVGKLRESVIILRKNYQF